MRDLPTHQTLVEELKGIRRPGLPGLRHCLHEALREVAVAAGTCTGEGDELQGVERLLAAAAQHLAGGGPLRDEPACDPLARAAAHTFGLFPDRRGVAAADRRKAAAAVYGVSTERFRRSHEPQLVAELAAAALDLAREAAQSTGRARAACGVPSPRPLPASERPLAGPPPTGPVPSHVTSRITIRVCPIELVRDTDILVSSENTYLEMSKIFRPTVSGALRRAAAVRNAGGEIVDDVLPRELTTWLRGHGRTGLPVRPGTVVPTAPGALASHGVRRVYHAAVSTPVEDGDRYHVAPAVLAEAVRATFSLARAERESLSIPLSTVCFPLLGAGRGGLPAETAARWLLWAVRQELREDSTWQVRLVARRPDRADALRAANSTP
ncbi:Appr-1-p processing protein [Streptomyces sp. KM273126]|uniref:macro domain-containing protein n=1 Tax=Streptomyces sp. KM273126 TaxID=2545247 RepID=UPI0015EBB4C3|nr:Appr-1-p processing protein [Streptomyces sp. KM273126]MBA2807783.1 Appr-1-p processing protein [Streptomyces sp. KM273126]